MPIYSNEELADIHYMYGFCDGNARAAAREYALRYPNRQPPNRRTFSETHRRFREGTLFTQMERPGNEQHDVAVEELILDAVNENPTTSTRRIAAQVGVPHTKVWRVLHKGKKHPFHFTPVQELLPADLPLRVNFCREMLQRDVRGVPASMFLRSIVWTDEAQFTRDGITNFHNLHEWANENPHNKKENAFQRRFDVSVWARIIDNTLIGPKVLPPRLNSQNYLEFLREVMPEILEEVPLAVRNHFFYQQDGAPAHYGLIVRDWLHTNFPQRWIGRAGPIAWPPRSPDLTPLDFFLWGYMKDFVYSVQINTRERLLERIEEAALKVREKMSELNVADVVRKRLQLCLVENGNHIENLL